MSSTLTKQWPPGHVNSPDHIYAEYLASLRKHQSIRKGRKGQNAREREERLEKIAPTVAPRLNLAKHLRAAVPAVVDADGERHEPAGLIKALHVAGGAPLMPRTPPALRKVDAAPTSAARPAAPPAFEPPSSTGEFYALVARQERDDREEVSGLMRKALTGPGLAIGGRR